MKKYLSVVLTILFVVSVTTISFAASGSDVSKIREAMGSVVTTFCRGFNSQCPIRIDNDTTVERLEQSDSWWSGKSVVMKVKVYFLHEMVTSVVKDSLIKVFSKTKEGTDFMAACWITKTKVTVELEAIHDDKKDSFELSYSDMGSEARRRIEDLKREGF